MNKRKVITYIFLIFFLILIIISATNIIEWNRENSLTKSITKEEKKNIKDKNGEKYLDKSIKKDNLNTVGWLIVEGTNINYPVVKYKDNDYYLNHDFNNQKNSAGWIFMDYQNKLDDQNIIIYGHHRRDGSMFGSLDKILNTNNKNLNISFITKDETINYKIFSIYKTSSDDPYNSISFKDFKKTLKDFSNKSLINFNNNYLDAKQIITLSTCDNNNIDRIVVHGYKLQK